MKISAYGWFLLLLGLVVVQGRGAPVAPIITNLVAVQRPGTFFVDVTYDLIDPDSTNGVYILAEASANNGADNFGISMQSLSGDAGFVIPGMGKKLVWNAWNDWANNYTTNAKVRLIADDFPSVVGTANGSNFTTNIPPATNLVWIPSGAFNMSGTLVYLTRGFWMSKYEVTQGEYLSVLSNNPSKFKGDLLLPVESVQWGDAVKYCEVLTSRERSVGRISSTWEYRLPTEAEWEYACRAGTTNSYSFGEDPRGNRMATYAWYDKNSGGVTHVVGSRGPNRWGLYDMHGNVSEWCSDTYGRLVSGSITDPIGAQTPYISDRFKNTRGGNFEGSADACVSWSRFGSDIESFLTYNQQGSARFPRTGSGFRVVLAPLR